MPTDVSSIINMSNNIFEHTTNVELPSSQEITANQKAESADDYILSMSQSKITTIKSHLIKDYAQVLTPIKSMNL